MWACFLIAKRREFGVAEEENQAEENQEEAKSSKKGIIIIAIITILAIGVSVGATLFLLGGDDNGSDESGDEAAEEMQEDPAGPTVYFDIKPPFLVTFNVNGRQRYMQIHLSVSTKDTGSLDAMEYHMPLIRSKMITVYGSQDFETVQTEAGKVALRELSVQVINEVLAAEEAPLIDNVFFTNFVLQ